MSSSDEGKEHHDLPEIWQAQIRGYLEMNDTEDLRVRLASLSVNEHLALYTRLGNTLGIQGGTALASLQDVFPKRGFEEYNNADYASFCREWDDQQTQFTAGDSVGAVYSATRKAALDPNNSPSTSESATSVKNLSPVLLTKGADNAVAQEAHLCPSTGKTLKCDTWMYVCAAVLGMPFETKEDRDSLIRAIRGSYTPPVEGEEKKKRTTIGLTGINRSPFNLVAFAAQKEWFDTNSGVIILPIMTVDEAKGWNGGSYSIIVLCNDGSTARNLHCTAADIARHIHLNSPETVTSDATSGDILKAHELLKQSIKASAFVLETKKGPETASKLWKRYRSSILTLRSGGRGIDANVPDNSVQVPLSPNKPSNKLVVKIDLRNCLSSGLRQDDVVAYPDPILLAFKSSVNWTREYNFQLIAEAEPKPYEPYQDSLEGVDFSVDDEKSLVSALSAATLPLPR